MKAADKLPLIIVISLLTLSSFACGKGKKNETGNTPQDTTAQTKTDTQNEYYVWVDNLRARKMPGKDGDILVELKQGEKLIFLGERSGFKDKVNLRGKEYEDTWMKVKLPDGRIGWVFGGAVTQDMEVVVSADEFLIRPGEGAGRIRIGDDYDELVIAFGKENVQKEDIYFAEGNSAKGFIIYKDTPDEIQCTYSPAVGGVDMIFIRRPGGKWKTTDGIRVGTPLDSLVKMNGKPISFTGFGWDYGGQITNYNGGKLGMKKGLLLSLAEPASLEGVDSFMGDAEFSTSDKRILRKGVTVGEIVITSGEAEHQ
jgi:hypothetical protein